VPKKCADMAEFTKIIAQLNDLLHQRFLIFRRYFFFCVAHHLSSCEDAFDAFDVSDMDNPPSLPSSCLCAFIPGWGVLVLSGFFLDSGSSLIIKNAIR